MSDTWMSDQLADLAATPPPPQPGLDGVLRQGWATQRRHRRRPTGIVAVAVAAAVVAPVTVMSHRGSDRAVLEPSGAGASPLPTQQGTANTPADPTENASYWQVIDRYRTYAALDGKPTLVTDAIDSTWLGNGRESELTVTDPNPACGCSNPGGNPILNYAADGSLDPRPGLIDWNLEWQLPSDPAALRAYLSQHTPGRGADATFDYGVELLTHPGPAGAHANLVAAMAGLDGVTRSDGVGPDGKPEQLLVFNPGDGSQSQIAYIAAGTGRIEEWKALAGKNDDYGLPAGATEFDHVYQSLGPTEIAPLDNPVAGATESPDPDPVRAKLGTTPTCTPGTPKDSSALAAQMAAICVPLPPVGYPYYEVESPDYGSENHFFFSSGEVPDVEIPLDGGGSYGPGTSKAGFSVQILPGPHYQLTGAKSPTPDAAGYVGNEIATGTTTVLGVEATEFVVPKQTTPQIGLIFRVGNLGVEAFGTPAAWDDPESGFGPLVAVLDSMHGVGTR